MPRWDTWGSDNTRSTLRIGVAGTPRVCRRSSQPVVVRVRKAASTSGIKTSRWRTRSRLVANLKSRSHSGWSTARQNNPQNFSAKIATIKWPSRVWSREERTAEAAHEALGLLACPVVLQTYIAQYFWKNGQSRSER